MVGSLSAFKEGKKYLLTKKDIIEVLTGCLQETQAETAAQMKGLQNSEVMEHRWLLIALFRLS